MTTNTKQNIIGGIATIALIISILSLAQKVQNFGASTNNPGLAAVFETSLAAPLASGDTSMTLASNVVDTAGDTLSNVYTCFTVDQGQPNNEFICGTVSGTSVTGLIRGISPLTGTTTVAALAQQHRRGADVKITDWPTLGILNNQLNGIETIPNLLQYANTVLIQAGSATTSLATKYYVDQQVVAGCSNADINTKGCVQIATGLQMASTTGTGSTGALLVIPTSQSTSTPGNSTSLDAVITQNNGKIAQGFLDLTQLFHFTNNVTMDKTLIGGISSTTYSGSTVNIDWSAGQEANVLLNQSTTITFSNLSAATSIRVIMCQDGTGSRTISAWPAGIRWATGFAPTLTTTANKCDVISLFTATSTSSIFGAITNNF